MIRNKSKYIFFLLAFLFFYVINAQKNESFENVNIFLKNKTNRSYVKSNGFYFIKTPLDKNFRSRIVGEVIIKDTNEVDIFSLNVDFIENDFQYYFVKNHNLLLVLKSIDFINKEIENEN